MRLERNVLLLVGLGVCSMVGGLAACSADGDSTNPDVDTPPDQTVVDASVTVDSSVHDAATDHAAPHDSSAPPTKVDAGVTVDSGAGVDASPSDAAADTGHADAALDGGVVYDPTGATCTPANLTQERVCGRCGSQSRLCWPGDAGATWLDWGPCAGEKADAGLPNTHTTIPCGMCGTKTINYDSQCNANPGFCDPAPGAECEVGAGDYEPGLSCAAGLGRFRTCNDQCMWGTYSDCTGYVNPNRVTIANVADGGTNVVAQTFQLVTSPALPRLLDQDTTCPITASSLPTSSTAYLYVQVVNPTALTATVSLWHSSGYTQMAVYAGSAIPDGDAARRACVAGTQATTDCAGALSAQCGGSSQYSLAGITAVTIPPNGSIEVYNGLDTSNAAGPITLNVRTDKLR